MTKWLRDVDVHVKIPLRAPGTGGFCVCACFTETYRMVTRDLLRTRHTAKIFVELDPDRKEPLARPEIPPPPMGVAVVHWPIDINRLKNISADEWIRIHFEEMHKACMHQAVVCGWPVDPFETARRAVLDSNYRYLGFSKGNYYSRDRRYRMRLYFDMDWEWFVVHAVLCDRNWREIAKRELARYPACGAPVHQFLRAKSGWATKSKFMFISSDNWFEPRQATISLEDFGIRAE